MTDRSRRIEQLRHELERLERIERADTEPAPGEPRPGRMSVGPEPTIAEVVRALEHVEEKADRALTCLLGDARNPTDLGLRGLVERALTASEATRDDVRRAVSLRPPRWPSWIAALSLVVIAARAAWMVWR